MNNIIFITHAEKNPSGGAKVIYRFSEIIDNLNGFTSEVIHIKKKKISKFKDSLKKRFNYSINKLTGWQFNEITPVKNFKYKWFENKVKIKENFDINKVKDFVILPEIFAHLADQFLVKNNIQYGIFVQNGYILDSTNDNKKLTNAYKNAKFILSISSDTSNCIKLKFPKLRKKIIQVSYSIDLGKINYKNKKNIITYMSRKLPMHSKLVTSFLRSYLPKNWKLKDLNNLSEQKTYETLKKSKIFLSFSSLEGLGLPPVEAALAGNQIIGYTGEGGKEYWQKPIFTKINSGEINEFVFKILDLIKKKKIKKNSLKKSYIILKEKFSKKNEIKNIKKFLNLI